jgi:hypothetical protein
VSTPRRPDQRQLGVSRSGVGPSPSAGIVIARQVIVYGSGTGFGVFVYSPAFADGDLVGSIAASSGTDSFGDTVLAGITSYGSSQYAQLNSGYLVLGNIGVSMTEQPSIYYNAESLQLTSGILSLAYTAATLELVAGDGVNPQIQVEGDILLEGYNLFPGQPSSPATAEVWHALPLSNSWANSGNGPAAQYRLLASPPNTVEVIFDLNPGTVTNGTTVATLPAGYHPASAQTIACVIPSGVPTTTWPSPRLSIGAASGAIACQGMAGMTAAGRVAVHAFISLDA